MPYWGQFHSPPDQQGNTVFVCIGDANVGITYSASAGYNRLHTPSFLKPCFRAAVPRPSKCHLLFPAVLSRRCGQCDSADLTDAGAPWTEIWKPLSEALTKLIVPLACCVAPGVFSGLKHLCVTPPISQLGWVNGEECSRVTMKLSSVKLLAANGGLIALPIFSCWWPDFTFHCCDGIKATWHLQTCFPLETRLTQCPAFPRLDPDF